MRRRGSFFAGSFASRSMIESGIFQPRSALALGENRHYAVLMAKIAYIGPGIMGAPMAGHLVRAGHVVTVFNRSMAKTRAWVENHSGEAAVSPAKAAQARAEERRVGKAGVRSRSARSVSYPSTQDIT